MTLFSRVTEICRERLPSIRVARITIDSIFDLDKMLQPGIRFGVTVRNTIELVGTPIASMGNFYFSVDVMDGDERWIIQKMENWRNGTYQAFYRIFYDEECVTRLDGVDGEELGWRNAYDVFQLNSLWEKKAGVYNLDYERPLPSGFYTLQTAVAAIPVSVKKQGLIIVFQSNHRVSDTYQFNGLLSEFDNLDRWEKITDDYDLQDARDYYNITRNRPLTDQEGDPLYYTMAYDSEHTELFAPAAVPSTLRKKGLIITFSSSYEVWESWQFVSSEMSDFEDAGYWVRKDVTKQLIESLLTGEIKSHRHPSSNYVLDSSSSQYGYYVMEQGAPMQASKSVPAGNRFIHLTISFQTQTAWESWQFIGTDITTQWNKVDYWLKIPVGPSLALGEVLGTAYDGSKGKANADAIASISSDLSTAVSKLEGIQDYAEVNQFAFSNIIVGSSTIASTTKKDTFELVEGSNITLSSSGKKITISSSNVDAGYVQVGSARIVYVPEDSDTGTPGYIKIQHADGSTAMHLVTTGGQTMYSTGVPAGGGGGSATVILNGEPTESATFWAPTSAGSSGQYLVSSGTGAPTWADFPTTFAPSDHTHDDRYYTVTDINDKLADKANWDTAYGWGDHALAGYANKAGDSNQDFTTKTLDVVGALNVTGLASFASGVGVQGAAITIYGKANQELPYLDFRHGVSGSALSRIISLNPGELSIIGKQVNGAVQPDGKIKLKNDTYVEKALYIGGDSGAKLVYVAASGETPAYLKLQNHDGGVMHFVTTGGQTMYSEGVPAAIEELQTEVMVIFNTSEQKADIIIGDRVKNRFMVIVPEATNGMIYINMIFNNVVPFGFLAEYEIYLYIESENVTNTLLTTECTLEPSETYSSGLIVGTLQSTDITGKGLHKLTYIRDIAAADTRMGLYVKHEYFEKV